MTQYISKSVLIAEVKRRRESNAKERYFGRLVEDNYFLDFLDTLEVKEVDLEKEIKRFTMSKELYEADSVIKAVAEHFFELGLKAQRGEEV